MPLILGIVASGNYPRVTNSFESIATTAVGAGGTTTVTFSSIPSTYKHLQIRAIARCGANGGKADDIVLTFNSDTGANYVQHLLVGNGSTAASYAATGQNFIKGVAYASGQTASANIFGTGIVDVLDYTNTNKNTTVRTLAGLDLNEANTFAQMQFWSGLWINTAAVTSIEIKSNVSSTISQYSQFALYGIKG